MKKRKVTPKDSGYRSKYGNLDIRRFEKQRNPKPISRSPKAMRYIGIIRPGEHLQDTYNLSVQPL